MLTTLLLLAPGAFAAPALGPFSYLSERSLFSRGGNQCKTLPTINSECISNIKTYSTFQSQPVKSKSGNSWSCGYGHQCKSSQCKGENLKFPLSQDDAESLLKNDLKPLQQCVAEYINVNVKVNDYQYGTLVSAAYYLGGCDSFKKSSVCQKINGLSSKSTYNDVSNICQTELPKWYSASGKGSNNKRCASQISLSKNSGGKSCLPCKNDPKGSNSLSKGGNDKGTQWNNNTPNKAYEKNTLGGSGNVKPSGSGKNDPKNDGMKDGKNDDRKTGGNDGKNGEKNSWGNDNDKNDNNKNGSKTGGEKSGWGDDDDNKNDQKNNSQKKDEGKKGDQNKDDGHKNDQNTGKSGQKGGW